MPTLHRHLTTLILIVVTLLTPACGKSKTPRTATSTPAAPRSAPVTPAPAPKTPPAGAVALPPATAPAPEPTAPPGSELSGPAAAPPAAREAPALPGTLWVLVENSPAAIPQDGLDRADWVFEVETEGGITRFLAGFFHQSATKIGPIRSARFYFLHLVHPYGGPIAHAGGNADALNMLARNSAYQDLDEIYNAGGFFWRSRDREPPHNLYTSTNLLLSGTTAKGYRLQPLPGDPGVSLPPGGRSARRIQVNFPLDFTRVEWRWQGRTWQRYQNGTVHLMQDQSPIQADTVIVMAASHYRTEEKGELQRNIGVLGSGRAWFFRAGQVWEGTWHKPTADSHLTFRSGDTAFPAGPGPVWVQVIETPETLHWEE